MTVGQEAWPDRAGYAQLVQVPDNFADDELRHARLTLSRFGGPQVWSGARAMVFQALTADHRRLAVRVFLNAQAADPARYAALSRHLEQRSVPTLVWTRWVDQGLTFGSRRVPFIKMQWVDGTPLDDHLTTCLAGERPVPALAHMADEWRRTCGTLTASDLAHGDIHAQNILVCPGDAPQRIRYQLVDYDGVWVPSLCNPPSEVGHAAYQHPGHGTDQWGRHVDAFPMTLVYLSLCALAAEPQLWRRFHTDDTLLFQSADLADARTAGVWRALAASPATFVQALTAVVIGWLGDRPDAIHSLEEAVAAATTFSPRPREPEPPATTDRPNVWAPRPTTPPSPGRQPWPPAPPTPPTGPAHWTGPRAHPPGPGDPGAPGGPPGRGPAPTGHQQWPSPRPGRPTHGPPSKRGADLQWGWVVVAVVAVVIILLVLAG